MLLYLFLGLLSSLCPTIIQANEVAGCGGFVQSKAKLNYEAIKVKLFTNRGVIKYSSDCAPNNGYYFIPLYDHGNYTIKIDAPKGWSFQPSEIKFFFDGETDICSIQSDVNFVFQGFSLFGRVRSPNSPDGPEGVQLALLSQDASIKLENVTQTDGSFSFHNLPPGRYALNVQHQTWKLNTNKLDVEIANDNVNIEDSIQVAGYAFSASVVSDNQPIGNVQFILFGTNVANYDYGCTRDKPDSLGKIALAGAQEFVCFALSNQEGMVKFILPNGKYVLYTFYEHHGIRFDVSPWKYSFEISHDDLKEEKAFQIGGFTITGKVVNNLNPSVAIKSAKVTLLQHNNMIGTSSIDPASGEYRFENVKTSDYVVRVEASDYLFEDIGVSISPNSPQLPTISPSKYKVCGDVQFKLKHQSNQVELNIKSIHTNLMVKQFKLDRNDFCQFLPGGNYVLSVVSPTSQLKFVPSQLEIKIDQPRSNVNFRQFSTTINGRIEFLDVQDANKADQNSMIVMKKSGTVLEIISIGDLKRDKTAIAFRFENVLPGEYTISLGGELETTFCWTKNLFEVAVVESKVTDVVFKQTGYHLQVMSSHSTQLQVQSPSGKLETHNIAAEEVLRLCLKEQGQHRLTPNGCHKFTEDNNPIIFDTREADGKIVKLNALKHSARVVIMSDVNITDLVVNVNDHRNDLHQLEVSQSKGQYKYSIVVYERPSTNVRIEPKSNELLFKPSSASVDLSNDCASNDVSFQARVGVFINGHVEGNIDGVKIEVFDNHTDVMLASALTDSDGRYTVGPFDAEVQIKLIASKEGFTFKSLPSKLGKFAPQKHSSLKVNIVDGDGTPLRDVLVSLSGGENNFRKNTVLNESGTITFAQLSDGEYFIRFVRKEYRFEPTSEMITLADGESIERSVVGTKVAFSCFGSVVSLNGEPETGIVIEAVGVRKAIDSSTIDCLALQEETASETNGTFRIMGLLPECEYIVRLKPDDRGSIRESTPSAYTIQPVNEDIKQVYFMVVYKQFQTDVVVSIEVDDVFLPTLSLTLYKEQEPRTHLFQLTSISSPFVFLPQLSLNEEKYTVRLESSLPTSVYDFKPISRGFVANQSFVHLHLELAPSLLESPSESPNRIVLDQDNLFASLNSVYLILGAIVLCLVYYNQQVMNIVTQYSSNLESNKKANEKASKENGNGNGKKKSTKLKKI